MGFSSSGVFPLVFSPGWCFSLYPSTLPFGFLFFFLIIFFHIFQEAISTPRILISTFNININSLDNLFFLFVYSNTNYILGSIIDSSSFVLVTFVGHSFLWDSAHPLDVCIIIFLAGSHVAKGTTCFLQGLENS